MEEKKMKKILILGAGLVAQPLVSYLLKQEDFYVDVATRTVSKAEKLVGSSPKGKSYALDVSDVQKLRDLVARADLVVSLLPPPLHPKVANLCVEAKKPMVTTSYVSEEMKSLDEKARQADIILLNEIGLDPGIDHMSAVKIIDEIHNDDGKVVSFRSYCGSLPAPEANTNPFGYKFSWAPRGLILDSRNEARYLENGEEVFVSGEHLFENYTFKYIEGLGYLEDYPNRNSLPYIGKYNIPETKTMYRGTLRYIGWCETLKRLVDLGLVDDERKTLKGLTYREFFRKKLGIPVYDDMEEALASYLHIDKYSTIMKRLKWLGVLSNKPLPVDYGSELDIMAALMLEKLKYENGERDMIILQHEFIAEYPDKYSREKRISTLINFGVPDGDTAIARTVAFPAAIAVKLILNGKITLKGVHIPVDRMIYEPVLEELSQFGITFREKKEVIDI